MNSILDIFRKSRPEIHEAQDDDIEAEEEPLILSLNKNYSKSYYDVAGNWIVSAVSWLKNKDNSTDIKDLNPIMREWLRRIKHPKAKDLTDKLDGWIKSFLEEDPMEPMSPPMNKTIKINSENKEIGDKLNFEKNMQENLEGNEQEKIESENQGQDIKTETYDCNVENSNNVENELQQINNPIQDNEEVVEPKYDQQESQQEKTINTIIEKDDKQNQIAPNGEISPESNENTLNQSNDSVSYILPPKEEEELQSKLRDYQVQQGNKVKEFIESIHNDFLKNELWKDCETDIDKQYLWECIERYVCIKVFRRTYKANKLDDFKFTELLQTYQFFVPKHLDITFPITPRFIEDCSVDLTLMNFFKTPRNKLICIANCCVKIFNYLEAHKKNVVTIDEFLPVLTYVVIKANPPSLLSNLRYIQDLRHDAFLSSTWGYFLTNLCIAVSFIQNIDAKHLSIGEEITHSLEREWCLVKQENTFLTPTTTPKKINKKTPKNNEKYTHEMVNIVENSVKKYKFWNYCADEIQKNDIPELLAEYKRLVLVEQNYIKLKAMIQDD